MKHTIIALLIICGITAASMASKPVHKFYDGEGNEIPIEAVDLLVKSQFVIMDKQEKDTISKYFYFNR